jgi:D-methionine transport system permease protein
MSNDLFLILLNATGETAYMVSVSTLLSVLFGLPLGLLLYVSQPKGLKPHPILFQSLSLVSNVFRSIPFIILLALMIPVTRLIVGSSIGSSATIVPLTIGAIPFFARLSQNIFEELPQGLLDAGISIGATTSQIVRHMLFPEALPALINAITVTIITLVSYSAMAGAVGGGGLGALAIDYGYQRFDFTILFSTVVILVLVVQCIQWLGDLLSKKFSH